MFMKTNAEAAQMSFVLNFIMIYIRITSGQYWLLCHIWNIMLRTLQVLHWKHSYTYCGTTQMAFLQLRLSVMVFLLTNVADKLILSVCR